MSDDRARARHEMRDEAESFTVGPGVAASKSQARGSLAGIVAGTVVGAVLGLLVGVVAFSESTRALVISVVAFAAAGMTFGGVVGGFLRPRQKMRHTDADT
jgi:F0F1-type ATP synthase assembly protein I